MLAARLPELRNKEIFFGPFRIDLEAQRLWQGSQLIPIRPKPFALLNYLLERAGRLVTKEELLDAVWPDVSVGEAVLKKTVGEIREALSDEPKSPDYIETAHRRGYRFIAQVRVPQAGEDPMPGPKQRPGDTADSGSGTQLAPLSYLPSTVVGREDATDQMRQWLDGARQGTRRIAFVTGEAGIGKTTLVEAFLRYAESQPEVLVGHGQCLAQYGAREPYMPVPAALARISRGH